MAFSLVVVTIISQVINAWPNKKLLDYAYPQQFLDMLPSILVTALMGVCVYPKTFLNISDWLCLPLQVLAGVTVYVGASALFKLDSFVYTLKIIKNFAGLFQNAPFKSLIERELIFLRF